MVITRCKKGKPEVLLPYLLLFRTESDQSIWFQVLFAMPTASNLSTAQQTTAAHLQPWAWLHNPCANPQHKREQRQPSTQHSQEPSTALGSEAKNWAAAWSCAPPPTHHTICARPRPLWALPHKLPCLAARLPSSCCKKGLTTVLWKVSLNLYQAKKHALYYSPIIFSWQTCGLGYRKWWKIGRQILLSAHILLSHATFLG